MTVSTPRAYGEPEGERPPRADLRRAYVGVLLIEAVALVALWLLQTTYGGS